MRCPCGFETECYLHCGTGHETGMCSPLIPGAKTTIRKVRGKWRVSYMLPYSGAMYDVADTWEDAMDIACTVERQRPWV